jgi:hypothetical protein
MPGPDVVLTLPCRSAFVRLARLNAAGLAADLSFSVDEIEDLRIAVDELFFLVTDRSVGPSVELGYTVIDGGLVVEGRAPGGSDDDEDPVADELVREILAVAVDEWSFEVLPGERTFRLVKRRHSG